MRLNLEGISSMKVTNQMHIIRVWRPKQIDRTACNEKPIRSFLFLKTKMWSTFRWYLECSPPKTSCSHRGKKDHTFIKWMDERIDANEWTICRRSMVYNIMQMYVTDMSIVTDCMFVYLQRYGMIPYFRSLNAKKGSKKVRMICIYLIKCT